MNNSLNKTFKLKLYIIKCFKNIPSYIKKPRYEFKKYLFAIVFFVCSQGVFAQIKTVLCIDEADSLIDQKFSINQTTKQINMKDDRKIFDLNFNKNEVNFKKSLSIRNLDSLISKKPEFFIYKFDFKNMILFVSISSDPIKIYKYSCKYQD